MNKLTDPRHLLGEADSDLKDAETPRPEPLLPSAPSLLDVLTLLLRKGVRGKARALSNDRPGMDVTLRTSLEGWQLVADYSIPKLVGMPEPTPGAGRTPTHFEVRLSHHAKRGEEGTFPLHLIGDQDPATWECNRIPGDTNGTYEVYYETKKFLPSTTDRTLIGGYVTELRRDLHYLWESKPPLPYKLRIPSWNQTLKDTWEILEHATFDTLPAPSSYTPGMKLRIGLGEDLLPTLSLTGYTQFNPLPRTLLDIRGGCPRGRKMQVNFEIKGRYILDKDRALPRLAKRLRKHYFRLYEKAEILNGGSPYNYGKWVKPSQRFILTPYGQDAETPQPAIAKLLGRLKEGYLRGRRRLFVPWAERRDDRDRPTWTYPKLNALTNHGFWEKGGVFSMWATQDGKHPRWILYAYQQRDERLSVYSTDEENQDRLVIVNASPGWEGRPAPEEMREKGERVVFAEIHLQIGGPATKELARELLSRMREQMREEGS